MSLVFLSLELSDNIQNILKKIVLKTKLFIKRNFNSFPTALKSPKPAAEPAPAVTTPVTVPVVGKKAGIYVYSMQFIAFLSLTYLVSSG